MARTYRCNVMRDLHGIGISQGMGHLLHGGTPRAMVSLLKNLDLFHYVVGVLPS